MLAVRKPCEGYVQLSLSRCPGIGGSLSVAVVLRNLRKVAGGSQARCQALTR